MQKRHTERVAKESERIRQRNLLHGHKGHRVGQFHSLVHTGHSKVLPERRPFDLAKSSPSFLLPSHRRLLRSANFLRVRRVDDLHVLYVVQNEIQYHDPIRRVNTRFHNSQQGNVPLNANLRFCIMMPEYVEYDETGMRN